MDNVDYNYDSGVYLQKEKVMNRSIAFFDFDGTITKRDTFLEFIKFSKGNFRFYWGFLLNLPFIIAFKLGIISNQLANEKVLSFFFKGMEISEFQKLGDTFSDQIIPALLRPKAIEEIEKHKLNGVVIVVVTASPENWVSKWVKSHDLRLISSKLEIKDGLLTGKLQGLNCHSEEKTRMIRTNFQLEDYDYTYAYGDSAGDKPMLKLAKNSFYKPFR